VNPADQLEATHIIAGASLYGETGRMVGARGLGLGLATLSFMSIAACGASHPSGPLDFKMPHLIGMTQQQADHLMQRDGVFDWNDAMKVDRASVPGTVIGQSPAAGTIIGSQDVVITIAKAPR